MQPQALCQAGDQGLRSFPEAAHAIQLPQCLQSDESYITSSFGIIFGTIVMSTAFCYGVHAFCAL